MARAHVGGVDIEYESQGQGEAVLFIHGAVIAREFGSVIDRPEFDKGRFNAITYDRRGYRNSSRDAAPLTMEGQAEDAADLLRHLGVERAHIVGHSFGGAVALALALTAPELVQSLVLLEPAILIGDSAEAYRESLLHLMAEGRTTSAEDMVANAFAPRFGPGFRAIMEAAAPDAYQQALEDVDVALTLDAPAVVDFVFTESEARAIEQPTLCVTGEGSEALWHRFGEVQRALLSWLPHAEGYVLPRATHALHLQNPIEFTARLLQFLESHRIQK